MLKCDYVKCTEEATTKGHIYGREQGTEVMQFIAVNACDKHKRMNSFFEDKKIECSPADDQTAAN